MAASTIVSLCIETAGHLLHIADPLGCSPHSRPWLQSVCRYNRGRRAALDIATGLAYLHSWCAVPVAGCQLRLVAAYWGANGSGWCGDLPLKLPRCVACPRCWKSMIVLTLPLLKGVVAVTPLMQPGAAPGPEAAQCAAGPGGHR